MGHVITGGGILLSNRPGDVHAGAGKRLQSTVALTQLRSGLWFHGFHYCRNAPGRELQSCERQAVTLAGSPATSTITALNGTTDGSGNATFSVTNTTAGIVTYTATDTSDGVPVDQTAQVTFTPGPMDACQSTITANPVSLPADGETTSTITVTLLDANNNPVSGPAVMLSEEGASNIIPDYWTITDANGQAAFTVTSTTREQLSIGPIQTRGG